MAITDEKYVLLTTYRKNGDAVATPVWIVALPDGAAGFTTELETGKVKRIRNNPKVTLQACSMRGAVKDGAPIVNATAEVLVDAEAAKIREVVHAKYKLMTSMFTVGSALKKLFRKSEPTQAAVRLQLN